MQAETTQNPDIHSLFKKLPKDVRSVLSEAAKIGKKLKAPVYVVGGFVRDLLLGIENFDLDLVVEGDGIKLAKDLGKAFKGQVKTHEKFRTSVVELENGLKIDVASSRTETYEHPAALPTVKKGPIKLDLFRRDFTVNGLAVPLRGNDKFTLLDLDKGKEDLDNKVIRVFHDQSFVDDPTRVFRAIRFEQRLGFAFEKQTGLYLESAIKKGWIEKLSGKRLFNEIGLILREKKPMDCLVRMQELDLLQYLHPDALKSPKNPKLFSRVPEVLAWANMTEATKEPRAWVIYLMILFYELDEKDLEAVLDRLEFPGKSIDRIKADLAGCKNAWSVLRRKAKYPPSDIYYLFCDLSLEGVLLLLVIGDTQRVNDLALLYFTQYQPLAQISLTGDDLVGMGLKPGPEFQTIFKALRGARVDGHIETRADEIALVKNEFLKPQS